MTAWGLLPWGALLSALAAAGLLAWSLWAGRTLPNHPPTAPKTPDSLPVFGAVGVVGGWAERAATRLLLASAALVALAFLVLLSRFLAADLSYEYVFLYTATDLPLRWRLAGTWAGREGSLLLWATYLAATTALLGWRWQARGTPDPAEAKGRRWTLLFLAVSSAAFLAAVVAQHTFRPTPELFLQGRPGGNGLNPTLKSPFILIHPPVMFLAYALTTVPAAAAFGHLASGTNRWSRIAMTPSRVDWLLYTFAIGLGGLWAYYTLGFGGYWAWDPVEVANLLPWLALTVYLHAQLHNLRHGSYATSGPFLAVLPFLLTLFSTISTRSGLWVSVHAFTDPSNTFNPDSPGRFLDILGVEGSLGFYVAAWLAAIGLFLALWCRRLAIEHGQLRTASRVAAAAFGAFAGYAAIAPASALSALLEAAHFLAGGRTGVGLLGVGFAAVLASAAPALWSSEEEPRRPARIDLRGLAYYSILVLGLLLLLLFLFHMASANGWSTGFYLARVPWLATPVVAGLVVLQGHSIYGRARSVQVALLAIAAGLVAALLWPEHRGGAYLTTLAAVLAAVSFDKLRRVAVPSGTPRRAVLADSLLLLGALLDVAFWFNPPSRLLGPLDLHLAWPVQLVMGSLALYLVWASHRILAGVAPRRPGHVHLLVGLLGAYYVAPVLAAAAWLLRRQAPPAPRPLDRPGRARLHQAGLYGVHFAVAVALLGYGPSGLLASGVEQEVPLGGSAELAGYTLSFTGTEGTLEPGTPYLAEVNPQVSVRKGGTERGAAEGILRWEPSADAHFPLPATVRLWERDLFLSVDAVHAGAGSCGGERWIEAYQGANPPRLCQGDPIDAVRVDAVSLPMLSLVWAALFLFLLHMGMVVALDPKAPGRRAD